MQTFTIDNLKICAVGATPERLCLLLSPFDSLGEWVEEAADSFGVSIAVVSGMDWDDDLTPWPAAGEPPGSPDFRGHAPAFLKQLTDKVLPEVESRLDIAAGAELTLAGVSLSGLFTLWQWMVCDTFANIISLSGSFWYDGFRRWVVAQPAPRKQGRAYFLLGDQEAKAPVRAFRSVQTDTDDIVGYLRRCGIDATFELVPGNHYQHALERLNRAFARMFGRR